MHIPCCFVGWSVSRSHGRLPPRRLPGLAPAASHTHTPLSDLKGRSQPRRSLLMPHRPSSQVGAPHTHRPSSSSPLVSPLLLGPSAGCSGLLLWLSCFFFFFCRVSPSRPLLRRALCSSCLLSHFSSLWVVSQWEGAAAAAAPPACLPPLSLSAMYRHRLTSSWLRLSSPPLPVAVPRPPSRLQGGERSVVSSRGRPRPLESWRVGR